jgi:hypothetical protein
MSWVSALIIERQLLQTVPYLVFSKTAHCYNFDTKQVSTVKYSSVKRFKLQVQRQLRMPIARYCLNVELVRVRSCLDS